MFAYPEKTMEYTFDVDNWGGQFSVPCSVATEYLKTSDGNHIKVLLCILASATRSIDSLKICTATGLDEDAVEDAVVHWTNLGVLRLVGKSESTAVVVPVQSVPDAELKTAPVCSAESVKPSSKAIDRKIVVSYTMQELLEKAKKDKELQHLFDEIQGYVKHTINGKELGILTDIYEVYHFDVPTVLIAAQYCNSIGKYSINYLYTLLKDWYDQDLTTYDVVEAEIVRRTEYDTYENTVRRCLGLTNRLTAKQKEFVEKWKNAGIDESLLKIACEKCLDGTGGKIVFKYIDTVISSWVNKGIKTPEQVKVDDDSHKGKFSSFAASEKENSYSIDKIEEIARNFATRNEGST